MSNPKKQALEAINKIIDWLTDLEATELFSSDRYRETWNKLREDRRILEETLND